MILFTISQSQHIITRSSKTPNFIKLLQVFNSILNPQKLKNVVLLLTICWKHYNMILGFYSTLVLLRKYRVFESNIQPVCSFRSFSWKHPLYTATSATSFFNQTGHKTFMQNRLHIHNWLDTDKKKLHEVNNWWKTARF